MTEASRTVIRRDYFTSPNDHRSYVGIFMGEDGKEIDRHNLFNGHWVDGHPVQGLLAEAGIADGDEFEIIVRKTGKRSFGNRRVIIQRANHYGPETDAQMAFRAEHGRIWDFRKDAPMDVEEPA